MNFKDIVNSHQRPIFSLFLLTDKLLKKFDFRTSNTFTLIFIRNRRHFLYFQRLLSERT